MTFFGLEHRQLKIVEPSPLARQGCFLFLVCTVCVCLSICLSVNFLVFLSKTSTSLHKPLQASRLIEPSNLQLGWLAGLFSLFCFVLCMSVFVSDFYYNCWISSKIVYFVIVIIGHIHRMQVWDVFIDLHFVIVTITYNCRLYIANL